MSIHSKRDYARSNKTSFLEISYLDVVNCFVLDLILKGWVNKVENYWQTDNAVVVRGQLGKTFLVFILFDI